MSQKHWENLKRDQGLQPQFLEISCRKVILKKIPKPFNIPDSIKFINIDLFSGKPSNQNFITESFKYNFNFDKSLDLKIDESDNQLKGFY